MEFQVGQRAVVMERRLMTVIQIISPEGEWVDEIDVPNHPTTAEDDRDYLNSLLRPHWMIAVPVPIDPTDPDSPCKELLIQSIH